MNRLLHVLPFLLLSSLPAWGQQTIIDTLHWTADRRLQLTDFHSPSQPGLGGSEFYYQIGYEARPTSLFSQPAIEAFCLMFRNLSWVSETARNERTLAYNQVLFDLVEIHTRQMKAKLIALGADRHFKQQATQIEYLTNAELGAEVNRFRAESGGGDDVPVLQQWQKQVAQRLYDGPDLVTIYRSSKIGYGVFVGGGGALPIGGLSQTLRLPTGVVYGLDIAFRRTMLLIHPALYNTSIQSGFDSGSQSWEAGMKVSQALLDVGFGRIIRNTERSRLIPFIGYRLLELTPRDRNDERYKGYLLTDHAPVAGLMIDIKFGANDQRTDRAEDSFWFVRTKLSYSPVLANKPFSGGMINFQIGLGGFGRIRKVSYQPQPTPVALPDSGI